MLVTRDQLIKKLSEESGYYQKDIKLLLQTLDKVIVDYLSEATDDEDVSIQLIIGAKLSSHVVPARERVDPRNLQPITVKSTVKPSCKFSDDFKYKIQEQYEEKKGD